MGLFDFLKKRIHTKDAYKRNIMTVYKRKYKSLEGSGSHYLVIHGYALAETLKDWCKYIDEPFISEKINYEIIPFTMMEYKTSLDIFFEYLMYRTGVDGYDRILLERQFTEVMINCLRTNPKYILQLQSQQDFNLAWYDLIDYDIHKKIFYS